MVHTDLPLVERIRRIGAHGAAAEIWDWSRPEVDLEQIAATGVPVLSMTGYLRGDLIEPEGGVRTAVDGAGLRPGGAPAHERSHWDPAPESARHRPGPPRAPGAAGGDRHRLHVDPSAAHPRTDRGARRGARCGLRAGESEPGRGPPGYAIRTPGGHPGPDRGGRLPALALEPGPVPRADRRREPDRDLQERHALARSATCERAPAALE